MKQTAIDRPIISSAGNALVLRAFRRISEAVRTKISRLALLWRDAVIAIALCVVAAWGSYDISRRIDPVIFEIGSLNIWFDADIPRIFVDMNYRDSELYTTKRHPLAALLEYSPVYVIKKVLAFEPVTAVRLTMALLAAVWAAMFFGVLRLIGLRRGDALLFSLLALTSSAAMFWLVVPETLPFGSVTILMALGLVALAQRRLVAGIWYVLVSGATLAATVTNWMFGVLATVTNRPLKQTVQITINAFCLVTLLWIAQKAIFPGAAFFFGNSDADIPETEAGGVLPVLRSFFFHSVVMPDIKTTHWFYNPNLAVMTAQPSLPGSAGTTGAIAAAAWFVLFGLGVWALCSMKSSGRLRAFVALGLLGQVGLHLLFGRETFFYAIHYQPLLIVTASLAVLTRARPIALALAPVVILFGGLNNFQQLSKATEFVRGEVTQSHLVQLAIRERPSDPWPRGMQHLQSDQIGRLLPAPPERAGDGGHIVLGWPGSATADKAYFEAGGNFSPAIGSFGLSIWRRDRQGNVEATSDTIPLHLLRQQFLWDQPGEIPSILSESPDYRALWSASKPGVWLLRLKPQANSDSKTEIVIRSVGPAGGPIHLLEWNDRQLIINGRWTVALNPMPLAVQLGEEGKNGWMTEHSDTKRWSGQSGWGYARFELSEGQEHELVISDLKPAAASSKNFAEPRPALRVELPDERFAASLQAQISQLMMGLVADGTRPGDPMSYPFAWLRDETYIVVALARSGQLAAAKELTKRLAEKDFFGGFGAEADAPGLAIWALTDLAKQLNDLRYDQWLWPHIRRKAELILAMLSTDRPIHKQVTTPVIPLYTKPLPSADPDVTLVADSAHGGLITGRIHDTRLPLYVSAVSYRGLIDAADMADLLDQPASAREWRARAAELKKAWVVMLDKQELGDALTSSHIIWPAGGLTAASPKLTTKLEARWSEYAGDNFWQVARRNAVKLAEAHQWLFLGRSDRAWTTLTGFWEHPESPGLYAWRTDSSRENSFNSWKNIRGWLQGQDSVTPSYTTAAEMLLLQLDMLAHVDETAAEPTVVIGAGVQPSWLDHKMRAEGVLTVLGRVDWTWDGRQMNVTIHGSRAHVRLGPTFGSNTPLQVNYVSS